MIIVISLDYRLFSYKIREKVSKENKNQMCESHKHHTENTKEAKKHLTTIYEDNTHPFVRVWETIVTI